MSEDKVYNLRELREIFRARMQERDFCIGEEQVEKLFRELLGEPEPIIELLQKEWIIENVYPYGQNWLIIVRKEK